MDEKKDIRELIDAYAAENFRSGLNCSESVIDALIRGGALKLPEEAMAMCIGFGGGVGMTGNVCGALLAAIMANGAVYGRADPRNVPQEDRGREVAGKYYRRYNRMTHQFAEENGGVACKDINAAFVGNWGDVERRRTCLRAIRSAAVLAYDFLQMPQEEAFALPYGENIAGVEK